MFLGLPDSDPLVRGMDPAPGLDPLSSYKNSKKNLDSYYQFFVVRYVNLFKYSLWYIIWVP
jgi:hypothetical protein